MKSQEMRQLEELLEAARGAAPRDLEPFQHFEGRLTQLAATSAPAAAPVTSSAPSPSTSLWVKSGLALSSVSAIAIAVVSLVLNATDGSSAGSPDDEAALPRLALETLRNDERASARLAELAARENLPGAELSSLESRPEPLTVTSATPNGSRAADDPSRTPGRRPTAAVIRRPNPNRSDRSPSAAVEPQPTESPVLREIRLLQPVREAISAGQPRRALATLDSLSIQHLGNHATALRAIALCDAGRRAAGRKVAQQLGTAATPSIFEAKVSRSCGETRAPPLTQAAASSTRSSRSETTVSADAHTVNSE